MFTVTTAFRVILSLCFFSLQRWLMTWEVVQYKSLVLLFCSAREKHTDLECGVGLRRGQKAWDPSRPPPHSAVRWPGHPVCQPGRNSCSPPLVLRTDTTKELFVMFSFMDYMHKWVLSIEQAATLFFFLILFCFCFAFISTTKIIQKYFFFSGDTRHFPLRASKINSDTAESAIFSYISS